jgi:starch synthase
VGPRGCSRRRVAAVDFVIDAPHLYARPGNPYVGPDGRDWPDNALRFAALAQCAAAVARGAVPGFVPDVVQAHDWQAGLVPPICTTPTPRPRTVITYTISPSRAVPA